MQQSAGIRNDYRPITRKLRKEGRSQVWLWRESKKEGKDWGYETFKNVCNGWLDHEEIEKWLDEKGYGPELRLAKAEIAALKARETEQEKQAQEAANV